MNQLAAFKKPLKVPEIAALVVFIIYLLFPFRTPTLLAKLINNPLGFLAVFAFSIYFFLNMHPAVGVLYLFFAYELVRRSLQDSTPAASDPLAASKTEIKMNPVNVSQPLETDKELSNYSQSVETVLSIMDKPYAPIGLNSNEAERARELARINPPVQVGDSLEEKMIRVSVPANSLHPNVMTEASSYVPVYDETVYSHSDV